MNKFEQSLTFSDRLFVAVSLIGTLVFSFPHSTAALVAKETPLIAEIKNTSSLQTYLTTSAANLDAEITAKILPLTGEVVPDPRIAALEEYLRSKKSPMADHAKFLLTLENYRFVIAISFAESNFCRIQIGSTSQSLSHNCWGIGGGRPERYPNYEAAFTRANQLIERYHNNGMTTPLLMRNTWVGWQNHSWPRAVEQVMAQLDARGL